MYPILLIAHTEEQTQSFLATIIREKNFSQAFVYEIRPLKTELTIDQIRDLKKEIVTATKEKRLIILYSFEKANIEAQNALLKTLEEKNDSNQFVLVVNSVEKVLPTIRSRCQIVYAAEKTLKQLVRESTSALFEQILHSKGYDFLADPAIQGITKEEASFMLSEFISLLQTRYLQHTNATLKVMKMLLEIKSTLESNNLNPQLTIDSAMIALKKSYNA